ncbi:SulP family inorganic anion transporter [Actinomadura sp. 9N407]|uniref:SulP family inorganic anion transporter n=1 Tax=Actinomadura sp. 9N407 TaxID=3375154 RepID=UPI00378926EC
MGTRDTMGRAFGQVGRRLRAMRPDWRDMRADAAAGVPGAVSGVPEGMANSLLVGVSPAHGLFANFAGPLFGGMSTSTRLMVINTTSAAALAAGSTLQGVDPAERPSALLLLTVLAGAVMIAAGVLRLGRYTRFVSHSVMIGFLTGIAVNIICGQLPDLTGSPAQGAVSLAKAFAVVTDPAGIELASLLTGLAALAILVALKRTRWAIAGTMLALAVPTGMVMLAGAGGVARVEDAGAIPGGFPLPHLPGLAPLSLNLMGGALAIALIVLVQGTGVAESVPGKDGKPSDTNRDFIAQGVGNLAAGLFRGQPVGGSVGQTALAAANGARTRWGPMWCGIWMLLILMALSGVVGTVAMPTLAAVLIFAASGALRPAEVITILRTGPTSQIAVITTFTATLLLPVAVAVGVGVALSLLMQLNQEAIDLKVVELVPDGDRTWRERPAPVSLTSHQVTALDVYGSLFYAGGRTLRARLPEPAGTDSPVVILRLRGRTSLGATFFLVITDYAESLARVGGRLYLSGLDPAMAERLHRTRHVDVSGPVRAFEATPLLGESTRAAYLDAEAWAVQHRRMDGGPRER